MWDITTTRTQDPMSIINTAPRSMSQIHLGIAVLTKIAVPVGMLIFLNCYTHEGMCPVWQPSTGKCLSIAGCTTTGSGNCQENTEVNIQSAPFWTRESRLASSPSCFTLQLHQRTVSNCGSQKSRRLMTILQYTVLS